MAAGVQFLDMVPKRPLRIFYLQTEIGYHYMRERLQQLKINEELLEIALDNLVITPQTKLLLNDDSIDEVLGEIKKSFGSNIVDVIAIDPLRNVLMLARTVVKMITMLCYFSCKKELKIESVS